MSAEDTFRSTAHSAKGYSNTLKLQFEIQLKIKETKFFDFFQKLDKLLLGHVRWICIPSKLSIGLHQCQNFIDLKKTITLESEVFLLLLLFLFLPG